MSFAVRNAARSAVRIRNRTYASGAHHAPEPTAFLVEEGTKSTFLEEIAHVEAHGAHTGELWRKISYYVCTPAIIACGAYVYNVEAEHNAHIEHIKHENGGVLPEKPQYEYLNRRIKPFPWGPNSLFFNPEVQRDMTDA